MHHTPQPRGLTNPRPAFKLGMGGSDTSNRDNLRSFNARLSAAPTPVSMNMSSDDLTEAIETVIEYLSARSFPYALAIEDFVHLQPPQVRDVCQFLITRLDPNASLETVEEDLPNLLRLLKYPATVTKSQLRHSPQRGTETLISAFCWLVKILVYIETCVPELTEPEFLTALLEVYGDCAESRGGRSSSRGSQMHDRQCVVALSKFVDQNERQVSDLVVQIEEGMTVEQSDLDQLIFLLLRSRKLFDDETDTERFNEKGIFCYRYMLKVMKAQLEKRQEQFAVERSEVLKDIARIHGHMNDLDKLKTARAAFEADTAGIIQLIATYKSQGAECQRKLAEAKQALAEATRQANEQESRTNQGRAAAEAQEDRAAEVDRLQAGIRELQDEIKSLEKDQTLWTLEFTRLTSTLHAEVEPISQEWQRCFKQLYNITEVDHPEVDAVIREIRNTLGLDAGDIGGTFAKEKWFDLDSIMKRHEVEHSGKGPKPEQALRAIVQFMQELNSALESETVQKLIPENRRLEETKRKLTEKGTDEVANLQTRLLESKSQQASLHALVQGLREKEQAMRKNLQTEESGIDENLRKNETQLEVLLQNRASRRKKMRAKHCRDDHEIGILFSEIQEVQLELLEKIRSWEEEFEPAVDDMAEEEILRYTEKLPVELQKFVIAQPGWPGRVDTLSEPESEEAISMEDAENVLEPKLSEVVPASNRDDLLCNAERAMLKQQPTPNIHRRRPRQH